MLRAGIGQASPVETAGARFQGPNLYWLTFLDEQGIFEYLHALFLEYMRIAVQADDTPRLFQGDGFSPHCTLAWGASLSARAELNARAATAVPARMFPHTLALVEYTPPAFHDAVRVVASHDLAPCPMQTEYGDAR